MVRPQGLFHSQLIVEAQEEVFPIPVATEILREPGNPKKYREDTYVDQLV